MSIASKLCAERMERLFECICQPSGLDKLLKLGYFYIQKQNNGPDLKNIKKKIK